MSLNSLICASDASSCFLLLGFPAAPPLRGGFSTDFWGLAMDEVKPKGFGEVDDGGRVGRGGEGTERGLGEEQRERGRCWGEAAAAAAVGSSLGGLGDAVLGAAFGGEVVRAMGEEVEEEGEGDSLRPWVRRASGLAPAARPVDWITLKCWCGSARGRDLCVAGAGAGGEAEGGMGTRVGGWWDTLMSRGSATRPALAAAVLSVAT